MIVPIPYYYPVYTKKEDARDVPKTQRRSIAFALFSVAVILIAAQILVFPRVADLYITVGVPLPILFTLYPYVAALFSATAVIWALYMLFTKPDYSKADAVAKRYKRGEMIKTKELVDYKGKWILGIFMFAAIGFMLASLMLPVYTLSSKL